MRAGTLTYKLIILKPETVRNKLGEKSLAWTEQKAVHAERVRLTGSRSEEVAEHFPAYSVNWNIRAAHTIEENWRVQEVGGYLYEVLAIEPNKRKGYLTLITQRVNE